MKKNLIEFFVGIGVGFVLFILPSLITGLYGSEIFSSSTAYLFTLAVLYLLLIFIEIEYNWFKIKLTPKSFIFSLIVFSLGVFLADLAYAIIPIFAFSHFSPL